MDKHIIIGVHITERVQHAGQVQEAFTQFGCSIRTRLGLHEADTNLCSPNGLILLEMVDDDAVAAELTATLKAIDGVEVQQMVFAHP
ncbi:MAG: hypothetical protein ISR84_04775 [Kiritimatiellales bacterium]|nr:hypothetical protein [Kiritimatiellota bacterium]MBL7016854.1 hypothetical protein [Kiritimatiellales bacterium]